MWSYVFATTSLILLIILFLVLYKYNMVFRALIDFLNAFSRLFLFVYAVKLLVLLFRVGF